MGGGDLEIESRSTVRRTGLGVRGVRLQRVPFGSRRNAPSLSPPQQVPSTWVGPLPQMRQAPPPPTSESHDLPRVRPGPGRRAAPAAHPLLAHSASAGLRTADVAADP